VTAGHADAADLHAGGGALMHAVARPVQSPRWGACSSRSEREITVVTGEHGSHNPTHAASGASTGPRPADGRRPPQRNIAIKNAPRRWSRPSALLSFVFLLLLSCIKANGGSAGPSRRLEARAGWPPYGAESAAAATTALVACVAWRRQRWWRDV